MITIETIDDATTMERLHRTPAVAIVSEGRELARVWIARDDVPDVDAAVAEVMSRARDRGLVAWPLGGRDTTTSELAVTIDRELAARHEVDPSDVALALEIATDGHEVARRDGEPVIVRMDVHDDPMLLSQIPLRSRSGRMLPLDQIATIAQRDEDTVRHHRRGRPAVLVLISSRDPEASVAWIEEALAGTTVEIEPL